MKQFTLWYAGHVIADCVYAATPKAACKQFASGKNGTVVATPLAATKEQNEAAKIASLVIPK